MFSSLFSTPEFKVGFLVLLASGLIATLALRSSENPSYLGGSKDAWFLLDDASGLVKRSSVKMAGIDVGIIEDIKLQNGKARVQMVIKSDVPITRSARIEIRPNGILGDKFVVRSRILFTKASQAHVHWTSMYQRDALEVYASNPGNDASCRG